MNTCCTPYQKPDVWVFASLATLGKNPYWGQTLMRSFIRPAAVKIGIAHIGWHTFRPTYSSLLRATKADIKVMQELLRNASSRVTLDTYTQAVTIHKRELRVGSFACFADLLLRFQDLAELCLFVPAAKRHFPLSSLDCLASPSIKSLNTWSEMFAKAQALCEEVARINANPTESPNADGCQDSIAERT